MRLGFSQRLNRIKNAEYVEKETHIPVLPFNGKNMFNERSDALQRAFCMLNTHGVMASAHSDTHTHTHAQTRTTRMAQRRTHTYALIRKAENGVRKEATKNESRKKIFNYRSKYGRNRNDFFLAQMDLYRRIELLYVN